MPPESRFRLERPFDIADAFSQRRFGSLAVLIDEPGSCSKSPARRRALATPVHQRRLLFSATGGGVGHVLARSRLRTPRAAIGHGQENMPPVRSSSRRRGRASNSVFPSWYPRTPLRDITAITRAIERRRACLGEENGETSSGQVPSQQVQDASPEQEVPATTPSTIKKREQPCPPPFVRKVHKILLEVAYQPDEGEFLTPQKKLLNSIDKIENVVMEELQRLKRTPSAKKAEREKRVRTLMSMR